MARRTGPSHGRPGGNDSAPPGRRGRDSGPDEQRREPASGAAARASGLTKVYGSGDTTVSALRGIDLGFPRGHFTAIMGPSGSGKSTLMHCMAGLDSVSRGRVFIGDVDLSRLSDKELTRLRRDRIGFIFQQFNLLPTLTAAENITLPLSIAGRSPDREWMRTVVDAVGLAPRLGHRPSELSGGQQQRVACARALVTRPEIIFADEPTGNLDSRSGAEVLSFLRDSVTELGQTVVMVTHDATAASYSDEVIFLADGRIVDSLQRPSADEVLDRMKDLDAAQREQVGSPPDTEHAPREERSRSRGGRKGVSDNHGPGRGDGDNRADAPDGGGYGDGGYSESQGAYGEFGYPEQRYSGTNRHFGDNEREFDDAGGRRPGHERPYSDSRTGEYERPSAGPAAFERSAGYESAGYESDRYESRSRSEYGQGPSSEEAAGQPRHSSGDTDGYRGTTSSHNSGMSPYGDDAGRSGEGTGRYGEPRRRSEPGYGAGYGAGGPEATGRA